MSMVVFNGNSDLDLYNFSSISCLVASNPGPLHKYNWGLNSNPYEYLFMKGGLKVANLYGRSANAQESCFGVRIRYSMIVSPVFVHMMSLDTFSLQKPV
jgi:hypothetical protein